LLAPLVEAIRRHVMSASKIHADDTPVPVLSPGEAEPRSGVYGLMFAMTGPLASRLLQRSGSLTRLIVKASIHASI
jgi:hypothetical protein